MNAPLDEQAQTVTGKPETPAPVIFAIKGIESITATCPNAHKTATTVYGVRLIFAPGPFVVDVGLIGYGGARIVLRFDEVNIIRQLSSALGALGSSLGHFLSKALNSLTAAAPKGDARGVAPRASPVGVRGSSACGAAAITSPGGAS